VWRQSTVNCPQNNSLYYEVVSAALAIISCSDKQSEQENLFSSGYPKSTFLETGDDDDDPIVIHPSVYNSTGLLVPLIEVQVYDSAYSSFGITDLGDSLEISIPHFGAYHYILLQNGNVISNQYIHFMDSTNVKIDTIP